MDSIKTNSNSYFEDKQKRCIGGIICVPEKGKYRVYIAWEWDTMAKKGIFGFVKSSKLHDSINDDVISEVCDYGWDISGTGEEKKIFKHLF